MKKTAAMFGLDARIALAIFGALSIITGAALYNSIKDVQTTKIIVSISEMEKAIAQYMLDTGVQLPHSIGSTIFISQLYDNFKGAIGWKGPYYGTGTGSYGSSALETEIFKKSLSGSFRWTSEWASYSAQQMVCQTSVTPDRPCSIYISILENTSSDYYDELANIFQQLEAKVDNNDGDMKGRVRRQPDGAYMTFYYRLELPYNHRI